MFSGFEILFPLGSLPSVKNADQMLVNALKMDWGATLKLLAGFCKMILSFVENISGLQNQPFERNKELQTLKLDKNFLKLELTS